MKPYLSVVVTSRNDNHGEGMAKRMRLFMHTLMHLANKHKLHIELLIVEWNPPKENVYLNEVFPRPANGDYLSLRYVIVPPEFHQQYRFAEKYTLYQMIAKNVGIRRAKGEFILCTNIDILFTDELMAVLKKQNLDKKSFYRVNRCDIPNTIDETLPFEKQQEFAKNNILARLGGDPDFLHIGRAPKWVFTYRWLAKLINYANRKKRSLLFSDELIELWSLDTLACGDFTLMHKDAWMSINGYVELDLYALHLDSMALIAAKALGYSQVILPPQICVYHIDHVNTWETMNPHQKIKFVNDKPCIGWDVITDTGCYLLKHKEPYNFNAGNWGFADKSFTEISFNAES